MISIRYYIEEKCITWVVSESYCMQKEIVVIVCCLIVRACATFCHVLMFVDDTLYSQCYLYLLKYVWN